MATLESGPVPARRKRVPVLLMLALSLAYRAEAASGGAATLARTGRSRSGAALAASLTHGPRSTKLDRARKLLADYRLEEADGLLQAALDEGARDVETLVLAGRIKEEMADGPAARRLYASAVDSAPEDVEALSLLARTLLGVKDYKGAARHLRVALKGDPESALAPSVAALYHLQRGNHKLAASYVERALEADPASKEAALVQADLKFLRRDLEGARHSIERLLAANPADPDGLYMMGIVLFNQKDYDGAQKYLERSTGIHRYAANFLKDLAQVYAQNGHLRKAIATLDRVLELTPADDAATSLQANLRERLELVESGVRRQVGPFRFVHAPGLSRDTFDNIVGIFEDAYREICPELAYMPPKVDVWIFARTGSLLPAYYSHVSDEIIISSAYFGSIDTADKRKLGRHLIFHEFSHLVLFQALGRPAFSPMALWLLEGLAEKQAGGYDYTAVDYRKTFASGLLDLTELADYLPVSAVGAGEKREKAYIQAYLMVDHLLARPRGLELLRQMVLAYAAGKSDSEVFAEAGLELPAAFVEAVAQRLRARPGA
ncbi:MAG: tetratricopeptide repeat protein [Candidatus Wallbacteria bacterium]|nr:tetratricopeptide repeat protein [Candidatus Wallbacteria bacterium]